jgi:hypothetical protein
MIEAEQRPRRTPCPYRQPQPASPANLVRRSRLPTLCWRYDDCLGENTLGRCMTRYAREPSFDREATARTSQPSSSFARGRRGRGLSIVRSLERAYLRNSEHLKYEPNDIAARSRHRVPSGARGAVLSPSSRRLSRRYHLGNIVLWRRATEQSLFSS